MTANFTQGHALLIGVSRHKYHPHLDVPIAKADAEAVQTVLQNPDLCGYSQGQVTLLSDSEATRDGIVKALEDLSKIAEGQTIFLFFTGHGTLGTDGSYYLLTHDAKLTNNKVTSGTGLNEELLLEKLKGISARRCLMIFNACHSAHIGPETLTPKIPLSTLNPSGKTAHALLGTGEGRILIVACRKEQYSFFVPGAKTSIFTQKLVAALEGEATARNGYIGAFGLYEYLYHEVKEAVQTQYGKVQEPVLTAVHTVGSFPVALYRGATALGAFSEEASSLKDTAVEQITESKANRELHKFIQVDTGGGDIVGHDMNVGGDYIRASEGSAIAKGDHAQAVARGGVIVGGSVTGSIITGKQSQVMQDQQANEIAAAFAKIQAALTTLPLNPAQKLVAEATISAMKTEAQKGEQAEESTVHDWLSTLLQMAPDIGEVAIQTFLNPIHGLSVAFRKVAEKARDQQATKQDKGSTQ